MARVLPIRRINPVLKINHSLRFPLSLYLSLSLDRSIDRSNVRTLWYRISTPKLAMGFFFGMILIITHMITSNLKALDAIHHQGLFGRYFWHFVMHVNYILFKIKSIFHIILILNATTKLLFQEFVSVTLS